jgi:hypothetical protein
MAPKHGPQFYQCWQARKILARFEALNVARAYPHFFGQFFLAQMPVFPQSGDISSEFDSMRTRFGFARRHAQIVSRKKSGKHEALLRDAFW